MCASMEGNAIFALLKLGLADDRMDKLIKRLLAWQWPDGGWNCDKKPQAHVSSFTETLIPLRGLALYSRLTGYAWARTASQRAAEIFLERCLFKRLSDGTVISTDEPLCYRRRTVCAQTSIEDALTTWTLLANVIGGAIVQGNRTVAYADGALLFHQLRTQNRHRLPT